MCIRDAVCLEDKVYGTHLDIFSEFAYPTWDYLEFEGRDTDFWIPDLEGFHLMKHLDEGSCLTAFWVLALKH